MDFNRLKTLNVWYSASYYLIDFLFTGVYSRLLVLYTKYLRNLKFFLNLLFLKILWYSYILWPYMSLVQLKFSRNIHFKDKNESFLGSNN